jgi:GH18 family chitinase
MVGYFPYWNESRGYYVADIPAQQLTHINYAFSNLAHGKCILGYKRAEAQVPWLYDSATGVFISYDDPESVAIKAEYIVSRGLGGAMLWELTQDDGELVEVLHRRLAP